MGFTWMIVLDKNWMIPFDEGNQSTLEEAINVGKIFIEVRDSHFPGYGTVQVDLGGDMAIVRDGLKDKSYRICRVAK